MKNKLLYILLLPFSWLYGLFSNTRNWLYDKQLLKSKGFKLPIIVVGNLSAGGTGKTPHVELLLEILGEKYKTAMLSRGYMRKSRGFYLANEQSTSNEIGDEPYQIYNKFGHCTVAVCGKRVEGISKILKLKPETQVIILDDGLQHRALKPGLSILLTDYRHLYTRDQMLPAGRLRESNFNSLRADIIVVTKCPTDIKPIDMRVIETELNPLPYQSLFFSQIHYHSLKAVFPEEIIENETLEDIKECSVLFFAGIVSPEDAIRHLESQCKEVEKITFPDHHAFSKRDFQSIENAFQAIHKFDKYLVTTEKDAARILKNPDFPNSLRKYLYYLPIRTSIINKEKIFTQKIMNYVTENTRNR